MLWAAKKGDEVTFGSVVVDGGGVGGLPVEGRRALVDFRLMFSRGFLNMLRTLSLDGKAAARVEKVVA